MAKRKIRVDWFLVAIIVSAVVATFFPASGIGIPITDWATKIAIAGLFFVHGVRLHPQQALRGLTHWRLHLTILAFTYVMFPLLGLGIYAFLPHLVNPTLAAGFLFLCLVPSTVQSSIAFTGIAKGNVAGAIVSASASNLIGVILTPLLAVALMQTAGGISIDGSSIFGIMGQILLPFVAGQLLRRWLADWVARHPRLKLFDNASIVLVVYSAFSEGMREQMWQRVSVTDIAVLVVVCAVLLAVMLTATWYLPRLGRFDRGDRIAIQFCGTKKSLASGLPMATVLFLGQDVGLLILPLMLFHQLQLMTCGWLAGRYGRSAPPDPVVSAEPARPSDPR